MITWPRNKTKSSMFCLMDANSKCLFAKQKSVFIGSGSVFCDSLLASSFPLYLWEFAFLYSYYHEKQGWFLVDSSGVCSSWGPRGGCVPNVPRQGLSDDDSSLRFWAAAVVVCSR